MKLYRYLIQQFLGSVLSNRIDSWLKNGDLQGAPMNTECNIWVSVCIIMTSKSDNHFQYIYLNIVYCNIETTTHSKNQNNLSRVYLFLPVLI